MLGTLRKAEYAELMILFFIQASAMAVWFVPLGTILDANGLHGIKSCSYAANALAAFVSPLIFGAMADRHVPPARVLRWLAFATAAAAAAASTAILKHCNPWLILALIQGFYLSYSPMFSISTALVLARLADANKEFGPVRALATLGWIAGALLIGLMSLDRSPLAEYLGAAIWFLVGVFTYYLPTLEVPTSDAHLSWHERLGLDAWVLLKDPDTRVVFIASTLFNIPISAFYPYAPTHLHDLGFVHTSAWMCLAQTSELIAMFSLAGLLLRWRLKWIFACGLAIGVLRFALSALNTSNSLLIGIFLHGASFVLVFITAQIYLNQRIDSAWRSRAQALLTLMNTGVGGLVGYLGAGFWYDACAGGGHANWTLYWGALAVFTAMVLVFFLFTYSGRHAHLIEPGKTPSPSRV